MRRRLETAGANWWFEFHRRHCSRGDGCRRVDRHSMPPGIGAERREERRAAVADKMEASNSNDGGRAVAAVRGRKNGGGSAEG